jgi:hypothetical protein
MNSSRPPGPEGLSNAEEVKGEAMAGLHPLMTSLTRRILMRSSHPRGLMTTRTTKFISSSLFQRIITMFREICISVKMRLMALGHPLDEAQRLADAITLRLVLLCTLPGCRMVPPDETGWLEYHAVTLPDSGVMGIRGLARLLPSR